MNDVSNRYISWKPLPGNDSLFYIWVEIAKRLEREWSIDPEVEVDPLSMEDLTERASTMGKIPQNSGFATLWVPRNGGFRGRFGVGISCVW
ncbi:hypothetical protein HNR46_002224 [Haloferula luteola]|uniref:Uncharacterized protein n=1 Tax=Haloferula luteola TaxID=595692 RepID=A0A840V3B1_9BACT|nr:hypothetical protein [Haloferula luteola]